MGNPTLIYIKDCICVLEYKWSNNIIIGNTDLSDGYRCKVYLVNIIGL